MTKAQKEAKELVDRFKEVTRPFSKRHTLKIYIHHEHAKNCALICVDEKQKSYLKAFKGSVSIKEMAKNKPYYLHLEEVKQEIEKL